MPRNSLERFTSATMTAIESDHAKAADHPDAKPHPPLLAPILKAAALPIRGAVRGGLKISRAFQGKLDFEPADECLVYPSAGQHKLPMDVYIPKSHAIIPGRIPIYINLSGGGFCVNLQGLRSGEFCRRIADECSCVVLDIGYRTAPEHPFPAPLVDVAAAVRWVEREAGPRGWDGSRICIGGFGAGGYLALVAASGAVEELRGKFMGVTAFYAPTDLSLDCYRRGSKSYKKSSATGSLPAGLLRLLYRCYLPSGIDRLDPRVSPLHSDPTCFARSITFVTCEKDSLTPEALELAERLKGAWKDVETFVAFRQGHGWDAFVKGTSSRSGRLRERAYSLAVDRVRESFWPGMYARVNPVSSDSETLEWRPTASTSSATTSRPGKRLSKLRAQSTEWLPVLKVQSFLAMKRAKAKARRDEKANAAAAARWDEGSLEMRR